MVKSRPCEAKDHLARQRVTHSTIAALTVGLALVGACDPDRNPSASGTGAGAVAGQVGAGGSSGPGGARASGSGGGGGLNGSGGVRPIGGTGGRLGGGGSANTGGFVAGTGASGGGAGTGGQISGSGGSGSCGMRSGMRGKTSRSLMVGSLQRTFIAYLPQSLSPGTPVPFVYVFHGANQSGQALYDMTEFAKLADHEGIAVVFPDGQGTNSATGQGSLTPWNVSDGSLACGAGALVSNPNAVDFAFVDAMRDDISKDQCLDAKRVYATGFSMGGYFSHHIACDRPDFRAAAPHSGATYADLSTCKTTLMPIIIFHGQADSLIAAGCDDPTAAVQLGFPPSATLWAKKNGCKETYTAMPETLGQCFLYDGCPAGGQVEMCTFPTLGHAWAGAPVCASCIGSGIGFQSATQLEWDFFKKYAW